MAWSRDMFQLPSGAHHPVGRAVAGAGVRCHGVRAASGPPLRDRGNDRDVGQRENAHDPHGTTRGKLRNVSAAPPNLRGSRLCFQRQLLLAGAAGATVTAGTAVAARRRSGGRLGGAQRAEQTHRGQRGRNHQFFHLDFTSSRFPGIHRRRSVSAIRKGAVLRSWRNPDDTLWTRGTKNRRVNRTKEANAGRKPAFGWNSVTRRSPGR